MLLTGVSALIMAQIKPNPFLFVVGVFTIYLVGTADRYIQPVLKKPTLIDKTYTIGMLISSSIFILWGISAAIQSNTMGWVMLTFGGIGLFSVFQDFKNYRGKNPGGKITMPLEKQFWNATFGQLIDQFGIHWMMNCDHTE